MTKTTSTGFILTQNWNPVMSRHWPANTEPLPSFGRNIFVSKTTKIFEKICFKCNVNNKQANENDVFEDCLTGGPCPCSAMPSNVTWHSVTSLQYNTNQSKQMIYNHDINDAQQQPKKNNNTAWARSSWVCALGQSGNTEVNLCSHRCEPETNTGKWILLHNSFLQDSVKKV